MRGDPKVRADGRCAMCKKLRTYKPRPGLNPALYESDPFCSSDCAKRWFGVKTGKISTST